MNLCGIVAPMIALLENSGFAVEHDEEQYLNHSDVAKFFPALCKRKLGALIDEEKNRKTREGKDL